MNIILFCVLEDQASLGSAETAQQNLKSAGTFEGGFFMFFVEKNKTAIGSVSTKK